MLVPMLCVGTQARNCDHWFKMILRVSYAFPRKAWERVNTPFLGEEVTGRVRYTLCDGKVVHEG